MPSKDLLIKQPQEEMLIHELLHFKFIAFDEKTREEACYEIMQHQLIETLARALYSAKYNLNNITRFFIFRRFH